MTPLMVMALLGWQAPAQLVLDANSTPYVAAATHSERDHPGSLTKSRIRWPTREHFLRVVTLQSYNSRVVLMGTSLLGVTAGVVGVFMLLRKRALVGDVVGHASLPGIAIAFLVLESNHPGNGKWLPGLLAGALVAGLLGVVCVTAIRKLTRIKEDAALAIVLGVFFGLGIALFTVVQRIPTGNAAGLSQFIYGKAASMVAADVWLIAAGALAALAVCGLLFKEFRLLCFDEGYAAAQGWPVYTLDLALMGLVVGVSVIGLQSVGLLLVVALLIVPAAAARFWTDQLGRMTWTAAGLGGGSAAVGVLVSDLFPRLAAGAVIVLAGAVGFAFSLLFGTRGGVLRRLAERRRLARRVGRHDLLRAMYEVVEPRAACLPGQSDPSLSAIAIRPADLTTIAAPFERLLAQRTWSPGRLRRLLSEAEREELVRRDVSGGWRLTAEGAAAARRVARNHRLWEAYLIHFADVAPSHVDRDADLIEHVLGQEVVDELERLLARKFPAAAVPPSPHPIEPAVP
jgi:manganese/zinc/iron transport system permease protein